MDIQRFFLIGLSAMIAYLLLIEWREFTDENRTSENISPVLAPSYSEDYSDPEILVQHPAKKTSFEELPEVINEPKEIKSLSSTKFSETISVETDVLVLTIDLNGGDIIEAKLKKFPTSLENLNQPFELLEKNDRRVYVAQSGLTGKNGIDTREGRAIFKAKFDEFILNPSESELKIDLLWEDKNGISITKRFSLRKGDYLLDVEYLIENQSDNPWETLFFAQIKRDSSPQPTNDQGGMGLQPFLGAATTLPDKRFAKFTFDDIADEPLKMQSSEGWIAMVQHYFLSAWIPSVGQKHQYSTRQTSSGFNIAGFTSPTTIVEPGQTASMGAKFYVGPKDQYRLEEIAPYLDLSVDYGWLWWIAQPLFWLLYKIHSFVGNWGFSIILLTILIKGAFFQLSATSFKSMANMRRVQPQMLSIREQYPDDKQKQSQAMMELYKKEKINPMGGCLPMLIQMPVFIALYWVLMESVELRHAPFALWIKDLSVMDPYFVLPLLMGASMWSMQKLNPPPPDPMQAKIMEWLPIVFTFFFLWFPAGLVLYWLVNNLLSMAQQYVITKRIESAGS